jgi:glycosyltransferase involved in cell wall biosynthesis
MTSDVILAFHTFCNTLSEEEADKCALLMHTQPRDENGTDLPIVVEAICPNRNVYFSDDRLDFKEMNFLYNMADVTINIASNEGFGLGTAESLMTGTPIIVNVTGGLQDQCGFKYKGKHLDENDYSWVHSLHNDKEWENNPDLTHGEWVKPVWPRTRSLQGSMPTPYIFDDRCRWDEAAEAIKYWYDLGSEERTRCGELGREWMHLEEVGMTAKLMCKRFMKSMDTAFETWKPRKRYSLYKV